MRREGERKPVRFFCYMHALFKKKRKKKIYIYRKKGNKEREKDDEEERRCAKCTLLETR